MADTRVILEILKYCSASSVLLHLSQVSHLFASQSTQAELWLELLGAAYSPLSPLPPKEQFRVVKTRYFPVLTATRFLKFNVYSHVWKSLPILMEYSEDISLAVTIMGDVFVTGVHTQPDTFSISQYTGEVKGLNHLLQHRICLGVIQCEGNIYAFGGMIDQVAVPAAEVYENTLKQWRCLPNALNKRYSFTPTHYKAAIYLVGGLSAQSERFYPSTEAYDSLGLDIMTYYCCISLFKGSELVVLLGGDFIVYDVDNLAKGPRRVIVSAAKKRCFLHSSLVIEGNEAYYFHSPREEEVVTLILEGMAYTSFPVPSS